jgi:hypothetical protein
VIRRFLAHRLSFPECISALDAALADLIPRLQDAQLPTLRAVMLSNNEIVMKEMERRGPPVLDFPTPQSGRARLGLPHASTVADASGISVGHSPMSGDCLCKREAGIPRPVQVDAGNDRIGWIRTDDG